MISLLENRLQILRITNVRYNFLFYLKYLRIQCLYTRRRSLTCIKEITSLNISFIDKVYDKLAGNVIWVVLSDLNAMRKKEI